MQPIIVDAHLDLAWNALTFGRDYGRPALLTRELEKDAEAPRRNGQTLLGLADLLLGRVAVIFGVLFASPQRRREGNWDALVYRDSAEAHRLYARQLDYYARLADEHPAFQLVHTRRDLEAGLATWQGDDLAKRRISIVLLMEGADGVREPREAEWWQEQGVRLIGPAWSGTRYAGGTGEPGPLTAEGRQLLDVMADLGLILDLTHLSDEGCLEALDRFPGVVVASHANPRALLRGPRNPERFLTDEMLRRLAERGGVAGIVPFNRFLKADWANADGKAALTLDAVVAAIDHVCQVTGSAAHVGLGTDFDGGFGVGGTPAEIDTCADLQLLGPRLAARGYSPDEVAGVLGGNWLRILRAGLPA
ncbi:MAG: membrane dipeptidase [Anaerolineales bacterium]|nr:membrane dipeptidase [Anaerolineales bacterium]